MINQTVKDHPISVQYQNSQQNSSQQKQTIHTTSGLGFSSLGCFCFVEPNDEKSSEASVIQLSRAGPLFELLSSATGAVATAVGAMTVAALGGLEEIGAIPSKVFSVVHNEGSL